MFSVKIDNRSNKTVKSVEANLIQRTTFITKLSNRYHSNKIVTVSYTGATIGAGMLGNRPNVPFQIPIVCPSLLDTCKIVKLEYMLV